MPNEAQSDRRLDHLKRFYEILTALEIRCGGKRLLSACRGQLEWPARGVYFFYEDGEIRTRSGTGPRVVRVGTHALASGSGTSLWNRLSQHRGIAKTGGGNHRGSIFRLLLGDALSRRVPELKCVTWDTRLTTMSRDIREKEHVLECAVSRFISDMTLLWISVADAAGPESRRGIIERNSIALLSNWRRSPLDPPSANWLGRFSSREKVREAGLWNSNHIDETYDPEFLDLLEKAVAAH